MSDDDRHPGGSSNSDGVARRVGTAERADAIAQLDQHWQAGRLDPGEHELRVTRAKVAVTQTDLDNLFFDLPRSASEVKQTGDLASVGGRGMLSNGRETIIALTPFAALALFFMTGHWLWFLMVPVMGILLYGPDGATKKGRGRDRARRRNRGR